MKFLLILMVIGIGGLITMINSYKILAFHPSPSRSQVIIMKAILKGMADKGHEVTLISCFPLDKQIKNFREIVVGEVAADHKSEFYFNRIIFYK